MPNTRQAAKRARQSQTRQTRNQVVRSTTKTALRGAIEVLSEKKPDAEKARTAYEKAVKALDRSVSKGALPRRRASRKISRITMMAKTKVPAILKPAPASK